MTWRKRISMSTSSSELTGIYDLDLEIISLLPTSQIIKLRIVDKSLQKSIDYVLRKRAGDRAQKLPMSQVIDKLMFVFKVTDECLDEDNGEPSILILDTERDDLTFKLTSAGEFAAYRHGIMLWSIDMGTCDMSMEGPYIVYLPNLEVVYVSDYYNTEAALYVQNGTSVSEKLAYKVGSIIDTVKRSSRNDFLGYRNSMWASYLGTRCPDMAQARTQTEV